MKNLILVLTIALCMTAVACSSQQKADTKSTAREVGQAAKKAGKAVGHAARDATREAGHFFRDTAKDVFTDDPNSEGAESN